jgi:hypothetical protein
LWLRIAAAHQVDLAAEPLVLYRQSAAAVLPRDIKMDEQLNDIRSIMEDSLTLKDVTPRSRRRARSELAQRWAVGYLIQGERRKGALPRVARTATYDDEELSTNTLTLA